MDGKAVPRGVQGGLRPHGLRARDLALLRPGPHDRVHDHKVRPRVGCLPEVRNAYENREIKFNGLDELWHAGMPDGVCLERDWEHVERIDLNNMIVRSEADLEEARDFFESWSHDRATGGQREGTPR